MKLVIHGETLAALTVAAALAESGNDVWLRPLRPVDAARLQKQAAVEPNLARLLTTQLDGGRLHVSADLKAAILWSGVHFLLMAADELQAAHQVAQALAQSPHDRIYLINRTTFPIGSTRQLAQQIVLAGRPCHWAMEPDFMTPGRMLLDFTRPPRILVGGEDAEVIGLLRNLYRPFNRNRDVMQVMAPEAAEMTKFATNAMLATRVSFINEMAQLAEHFGVDVEQVRQGLGSDPRIGYDFLYPGVGFGGPHFAQDVANLAETMRVRQVPAGLLSAVLAINASQKEVLFRKAWQHYDMQLAGRTFTLWGLSYKPGTDSVINAASIPLTRALLAQGARVRVHDPAAVENYMQHFAVEAGEGQVTACEDPYTALTDSSGLMLLTEWKPYWNPDFERMMTILREPVIFDGRNIYEPALVEDFGFTYYGVGRGRQPA
ncbi:UDPglucose 6-dehydrogenase [Sulfurivirga caldicuralii]|uniref:UDP-glucose 6-dehydrogenase n=1 Tax=Sulfurivirga caldicuralii TaxID=364032 RepID=A0A1N6DQ67_9GAMM|nr:nucleotide sugar dehydrogenase [Sulfurivirga caldicuralii]SIN72942.1 UDPglucose 6-dehydrogenase [Sulfurivirga caldicuralii]